MRMLRSVGCVIAMFVMATALLTGCGKLGEAIDSVTSKPSAPTGVRAVAANGEITVSWDHVSGIGVKYNIYWSNSPGVTPTNAFVIPEASSPYSFRAINGRPFYFVVTAIGVKGESSPSAEVSATPSEAIAPFIRATVLSYAGGVAPWGHNAMISVYPTSAQANAIVDAVVTVNGTTIPWNQADGEYSGNVSVAPGENVDVSVTVGGSTYTATGTQFAVAPTIYAPSANAVWPRSSTNRIMWNGGGSVASSVYAVAILNQSYDIVYPTGDKGPHEVPITSTYYDIPGNTLAAGTYYVLTGVATPGIGDGSGSGIPFSSNAVAGSRLQLGAVGTLVPITVQ